MTYTRTHTQPNALDALGLVETDIYPLTPLTRLDRRLVVILSTLALIVAGLFVVQPSFHADPADHRIAGVQTTFGYLLTFPDGYAPHVEWYGNGTHARTQLGRVVLRAR